MSDEVQYIEDFLSPEMIEKVENAIRVIKDDEDFFDSVFMCLNSDEDAEKVLEYMKIHPDTTRRDLMIYIIMRSRGLID